MSNYVGLSSEQREFVVKMLERCGSDYLDPDSVVIEVVIRQPFTMVSLAQVVGTFEEKNMVYAYGFSRKCAKDELNEEVGVKVSLARAVRELCGIWGYR